MGAYGHKQCKSAVEVVEKEVFDSHTHGNITNGGKIANVSEVRIVITDQYGNITATRTINADVTFDGTLTATKLAATGDAVIAGTLTAAKVVGAVYA